MMETTRVCGTWFAIGITLMWLWHWITNWPLWSKLWKKFNDKLDEWADV